MVYVLCMGERLVNGVPYKADVTFVWMDLMEIVDVGESMGQGQDAI